MKGWTPLTECEYDAVWDRFYDHFTFRPSVSAADWPSIQEPNPSITFRFTYDDACEIKGYESWVLNRLREITDSDSSIYALDWQHESFWFRPHEATEFEVPPFPNGDYYIFLTQDFSTGLFGHPWEQTICIFGDSFIDAARENLPELLSTVHRSSGVDVSLGREQNAAEQPATRLQSKSK